MIIRNVEVDDINRGLVEIHNEWYNYHFSPKYHSGLTFVVKQFKIIWRGD